MFIKAADGLVIRNPATKALVPAEGLEVPDGDLFWTRLLAWGDIVEVKPAAAAIPAKSDRSADK